MSNIENSPQDISHTKNALNIEWTAEQTAIIGSSKSTRLLVDAGPGTGKTAVLGARISYLIQQEDVSPDRIWVISFTRTAILELRDRLERYLKVKASALGVRVVTIDSGAWAINSGFNLQAEISGTHNKGIREVIELIQANEGVFSYLNTIEHLFIDEAQDVVGIRAEMLLEFINAIPEHAGVTVFSDDAQAIYGSWSTGKEKLSSVSGTLPENIRNFFSDRFQEVSLTKTHRTDDPILKNLYDEGRRLLLSDESGIDKLRGVRQLIRTNNHSLVESGNVKTDMVDPSKTQLYLFRSRAEALVCINSARGLPHRIRMTGTSPLIEPWVAVMFWDWLDTEIDKATFFERWSQRIGGNSVSSDQLIWRVLIQNFGITDDRVDIQRLCNSLSSFAPPAEFCTPDLGFQGPIIGTVHTSKGREADVVTLTMPTVRNGSTNSDYEEEARVMFVGATRARENLYVSRQASPPGKTMKDGQRAYMETGLTVRYVHVEVGRNNDILPTGLTGLELYSPQELERAQNKLRKIWSSYKLGMAKYEKFSGKASGKHVWALYLDGDKEAEPVAFFSKPFNRDMQNLPKEYRLRGHGKMMSECPILGARTVAVSANDPLRSELHPPYNDSGFMLAPVVYGFPLIELTKTPSVVY